MSVSHSSFVKMQITVLAYKVLRELNESVYAYSSYKVIGPQEVLYKCKVIIVKLLLFMILFLPAFT